MKREAMLRMVQSGMLPIELKVATLAAAREEAIMVVAMARVWS